MPLRARLCNTWLAAVLVCSVVAGNVEEYGGPCVLSELFLSAPADAYGSARPIELHAVKDVPRRFKAVLDYSMVGFDLAASAAPEGRCRARKLLQSTALIDPGSRMLAEVIVENLDGRGGVVSKDYYKVEVSRLSGSETTLDTVQVEDGAVLPEWDPDLREYDVFLSRRQDLVRFTFQRADSGQVVSLENGLEALDSRWLPPGPARRLSAPRLGELQHGSSTLVTTLDLGYRRKVSLEVQSADQAETAKYEFTVHREPCPQQRPFYNPVAHNCTDLCSAGYFGSPAGRCMSCGVLHCASCVVVGVCLQCMEGYEVAGTGCKVAGRAFDPLQEAEAAVLGWPAFIKLSLLATSILVLVVCTCLRHFEGDEGAPSERQGGALGVQEDSYFLDSGRDAYEDIAYQG